MSNIVLLVVDVQNALISEHPYNEQNVINNIHKLILAARNYNREVIFVRHDGGEGSELELGSYGWQIFDLITPSGTERIIDKKYNSAFHQTNLKQYLDSKQVDTILLVGLQTEYCIDTTLKSAFDYGYKVIIPEETNTTFDNEYLTGEKLYEFYNNIIWNNRFADIVSIDASINILEQNI